MMRDSGFCRMHIAWVLAAAMSGVVLVPCVAQAQEKVGTPVEVTADEASSDEALRHRASAALPANDARAISPSDDGDAFDGEGWDDEDEGEDGWEDGDEGWDDDWSDDEDGWDDDEDGADDEGEDDDWSDGEGEDGAGDEDDDGDWSDDEDSWDDDEDGADDEDDDDDGDWSDDEDDWDDADGEDEDWDDEDEEGWDDDWSDDEDGWDDADGEDEDWGDEDEDGWDDDWSDDSLGDEDDDWSDDDDYWDDEEDWDGSEFAESDGAPGQYDDPDMKYDVPSNVDWAYPVTDNEISTTAKVLSAPMAPAREGQASVAEGQRSRGTQSPAEPSWLAQQDTTPARSILPQTGDNTPVAAPFALVLAGLFALLGGLHIRKRYR